MAYFPDVNLYPEKLIRQVATMHFVDGMTHDEIAEKLQISARAKVVAMCKAARLAGWVRVAVMPSRQVEGDHLRYLGAEVRDKYHLLDCIVTHGRSEMLQEVLDDNVREVIMDDITRLAALELDRRLGQIEHPCLAVNYGVVTRKIESYLRPNAGIKSTGQTAKVVAAQGVRSLQIDRFDANNVVRDIARQYGYEYQCIPIPAFVGEADVDSILRMPLVTQVMETLDKTNIVIGSLGSPHQAEGRKQADSLQRDLFDPSHMARIRDQHGLANIGGWWFDASGVPLPYTETSIVGLTLTRIKRLVAAKQPVILAVGADATRVPGLRVALTCKLANILITDEVTAGILLGKHKFTRQVVHWLDAERAILKSGGALE